MSQLYVILLADDIKKIKNNEPIKCHVGHTDFEIVTKKWWLDNHETEIKAFKEDN